MTDNNGNEMLIIRQIMRDKGISVSKLAQMIGITQPAMSQILSKKNVMVSTIYSIAQALQVEIADLFAVPEGYQHYSVRNNSGVGQTEKGAEEQTEAEKDTDSDTTEVQQTVDGSGAELKAMFCPKCGTKFFVEM